MYVVRPAHIVEYTGNPSNIHNVFNRAYSMHLIITDRYEHKCSVWFLLSTVWVLGVHNFEYGLFCTKACNTYILLIQVKNNFEEIPKLKYPCVVLATGHQDTSYKIRDENNTPGTEAQWKPPQEGWGTLYCAVKNHWCATLCQLPIDSRQHQTAIIAGKNSSFRTLHIMLTIDPPGNVEFESNAKFSKSLTCRLPRVSSKNEWFVDFLQVSGRQWRPTVTSLVKDELQKWDCFSNWLQWTQ